MIWLRGVVLCVWVGWSLASGLGAQPSSRSPVTALAFAPDGQALLVGSQLGVQVLSWPTLHELRQIPIDMSNLHDIVFSPDGTQVAVGGGDPAESGEIVLLAWPAGTVTKQFAGHADCVMSLGWIDQAHLASASMDQRVIVWDVAKEEPTHKLLGHSRGISGLALVRNGEVLISGSLDQSLRVWDVRTGELLNSLLMHTQPIHRLAVRPNLAPLPMLASSSDDRTVRLWQPTIGRMVRFARLNARPLELCWLADGSQLVAGCDDGALVIIDPDTIQVVDRREVFPGGRIYALIAHPNDGSLAAGGSQGQVVKVDL